MRLLHTETKELESFDNDILTPDYAILSHRWLDGEITFQDMSRLDVTEIQGYAKLSSACYTARSMGLSYLWMDTCCIDKSSSSELSEAINSMHAWYKRAIVCIVYLDDVKKSRWAQEFRQSLWFTRGWTLQELIAPSSVLFLDHHWQVIGFKADLTTLIAEITGVHEDVLRTGNVESMSVAARMSWASGRSTTRVEDSAYSLMGIFGVNMPTIYGEGRRALMRLQEEIMKNSNDQSIFAWGTLRTFDGYAHSCTTAIELAQLTLSRL